MIGERLYDLRKDAGLSQQQLADILKINKHSISAYEREKSEPPDPIKIEIAKFFHVSVDYLLGLTEDPVSYDRENRSYIRLPKNFPIDKISELEDLAEFLANKYKHTK